MTKVVVANAYADSDGRKYKGGDVVDVSPGEARVLLIQGKAREPEEPKPAVPAVKEAKNG